MIIRARRAIGLSLLLGLLFVLAIFHSSCERPFEAPAKVEIQPSMQKTGAAPAPAPIQTTITLHADQATTVVMPFWIDCIGTCNGMLWGARTKDYAEQLAYVHKRLGVKEVRFHNILSLVPPPVGRVCDFKDIDRVYDAILTAGARPLVEVSFMPPWMASGTKTVFHYKGNVTPPRDLGLWRDFLSAFARHLEKRYGADEVRQWRFEIWNEPDLSDFWTGSNNWGGRTEDIAIPREDYYQLYKAARQGLHIADPLLIIGGPSAALTSKNPYGGLVQWFMARIDQEKTPLDFMSWHIYGAIALLPNYEVRSTTELRSWFDEIHEICKPRKLPLLVTEWNSTPTPVQNLIHDEALNAAFALNMVREARGKCDLFSYWTMSDLFEEQGLTTSELSGSFGLLSLRGIEKPVFKAFEMLNLTRGAKWIAPAEGLDAQAIASWDAKRDKLVVIVWNWPYDKGGKTNELKAEARDVNITISGVAKGKYLAAIYPLDQTRANMTTAWRAMGSPANPNLGQRAKLEQAARLIAEKSGAKILTDENTKLTWKARLEPGDCCALVLSPSKADLELGAWERFR